MKTLENVRLLGTKRYKGKLMLCLCAWCGSPKTMEGVILSHGVCEKHLKAIKLQIANQNAP